MNAGRVAIAGEVMPVDTSEEGRAYRAANAGSDVAPRLDQMPGKLLEELSAAQSFLRSASRSHPPVDGGETLHEPPLANPMPGKVPAAPMQIKASGRAKAYLRARALVWMVSVARLRRRFGLRDWERRYLTFLSLVHKHIFDRAIERLLFLKTAYPQRYFRDLDGGQKDFLYQGPLPAKALHWALSALPADLKRYAFADFHARNGRNLLLAARRNFEHATGYAFNDETCEILEMNLAQYSRSYMSCRDVRALRADRDGLAIPAQPAVLLFPDGLAAGHLAVILEHISASLRTNPRPVYLIFENAGIERGFGQIKGFEKVPLPLLNRIKTVLFSPVLISVYRSIESGNG